MIALVLDVLLIALLSAAIVYAAKLLKQLGTLRSSRAEMERFVITFNGTVLRAEAGIKELKHAARESGDDLEQLIEKARKVSDELTFLVESADQIATRLSDNAIAATSTKAAPTPAAAPVTRPVAAAQAATTPAPASQASTAGTTAERDLMKALEKLK